MSDTPVRSPIELIAAFESGFAGVAPQNAPRASVAERLEVFRECIAARRKSGYSWGQITQVLRQPKIGIVTSPGTLRQLFSDAPRKGKRASKGATKLRALPPAGQPVAPAK